MTVEYLTGDYTLTRHDECPRNRNVHGYGVKIPTHCTLRATSADHSVLQDTRERRVYAVCCSNVASIYVIVRGKKYIIPEHRY